MAVTRLAFQLAQGTNIIDLAKSLSIHHRTLVRQKQIFTVYGGMFVDNVETGTSQDGKFTISTAPNSWYTRAAVNRTFRAWKQMRSKTLDNAGQDGSKAGTGKFSDFKVLLNGDATSKLRTAIATGTAGSRPNLAGDEWSYSQLESEAGATTYIQIVGDHNPSSNRYSALKGWVSTRALPYTTDEPEMPDLNSDGTIDIQQDMIATMYDTSDGQTDRLNLVYTENDDAPFHQTRPYADDSSQNLQLQCLGYATETNPTQMVPGFEALCGLLHVEVASDSAPILFIDVESRGRKF